MSTYPLSDLCKETIVSTILCGSTSAVVNAGVVWGTRFINQIPTQTYIPALMVGFIHSLTFSFSFTLGGFEKDRIKEYFIPNFSRLEKHRSFIGGASLLIATLVTIASVPTLATLAHRSISYKEAAAFALINSITIFLFMDL